MAGEERNRTKTNEIKEQRAIEIHTRINEVSAKVNKIIGGIIVAATVLGLIGTGIMYHVNFRFGNIEKSLEKIERKIERKFP